MNNRLCYFTHYLMVKQIKQNGKIVGYMDMTEKAYEIVVKLHYFNIPGYKINKSFTDPIKAYRFFNSVYETENNK